VEFDMTWKEPTEAQLDAWRHCCRAMKVSKKDMQWFEEDVSRHRLQVSFQSQGRILAVDADQLNNSVHDQTPWDLAEMMWMADKSFWYNQASAWAKGKTPEYCADEGTSRVFQLGGQAIVSVVDWGYQDGEWWNINKAFSRPGQATIYLGAMVDTCRMARLASRKSTYISSAMFTYLPSMILPPRANIRNIERALSMGTEDGAIMAIAEIRSSFDTVYRKIWLKAKREAKAQVAKEYEPIICIHPNCDNLVAPKGITPREGHFKNYRGLNACQRGHQTYYCKKCKKPHGHTSKTGKAHFEKHYGCDWTAEAKAAWEEGKDPTV